MCTIVPQTVPFQGDAEWGLKDPNFKPLTLMREPAQLHLPLCGRHAHGRLRFILGSLEVQMRRLLTESHLQSPQICVAVEKAPAPPLPDPGIRDYNRNPR